MPSDPSASPASALPIPLKPEEIDATLADMRAQFDAWYALARDYFVAEIGPNFPTMHYLGALRNTHAQQLATLEAHLRHASAAYHGLSLAREASAKTRHKQARARNRSLYKAYETLLHRQPGISMNAAAQRLSEQFGESPDTLRKRLERAQQRGQLHRL